jgi:hypothetical protein
MRSLLEAKFRLKNVCADDWPLLTMQVSTCSYASINVVLTDTIFARHRSPALVLFASQSLSPRTRDCVASSRAVSQILNTAGSRARGRGGKNPVSSFICTSNSVGLRCASAAKQRGPRTDAFNNDMASRSSCGGEGRQLVMSIVANMLQSTVGRLCC